MKSKVKLYSLFVMIILVLTLLAACSDSSNTNNSLNNSSSETIANDSSSDNTEKAQLVDSMNVTMAGGAAGGFWSMLGEGIGGILREENSKYQYSLEPS